MPSDVSDYWTLSILTLQYIFFVCVAFFVWLGGSLCLAVIMDLCLASQAVALLHLAAVMIYACLFVLALLFCALCPDDASVCF